jgi:alanine dehydrogenase
MTLVLDNNDVLAAADMTTVISALEEAMAVEARGGVDTVPRINLGAGSGGFFRVMPAVIEELDLMGLKAFNASKDGTVRYLIGLWAVSSGELLALVDASELTAIRTGAVTGVAQAAVAGGHFDEEVGVIGSGLEARTNLEAICAVADVGAVKIFSPRRERREAFAREMSARLGVEVRAVAHPAEAADAPTVLVATNTGVGSGVLALEAGWVRSQGHVNTIGSTMPDLREVDSATFGRADVIVLDTLDSVEESGDLLDAAAGGHWVGDKVHPLSAYFTGAASAPQNDGSQLTVFKSVGTALQDLVAAKAIYEVARERGLGHETQVLSEKQFEGLTATPVAEGGTR